LFGWKVRLLTRGLQGKSCPAGRRLAVTVRPRESSRTIRVHRFDDHPKRSGGSSPIGRQAAAAIDNSTSIRYVGLGHPVKPGACGHRALRHLYTPCGQRLEPRSSP
jgi:hypothetical protein